MTGGQLDTASTTGGRRLRTSNCLAASNAPRERYPARAPSRTAGAPRAILARRLPPSGSRAVTSLRSDDASQRGLIGGALMAEQPDARIQASVRPQPPQVSQSARLSLTPGRGARASTTSPDPPHVAQTPPAGCFPSQAVASRSIHLAASSAVAKSPICSTAPLGRFNATHHRPLFNSASSRQGAAPAILELLADPSLA
jgi:hypothetical protein